MRSITRLSLLVGWVAACGGTAANQEGDLSAQKSGSVEAPLAPREAPDAGFSAECGDGELSDAGKSVLRRGPFLQQVSSQGALVVFQADKPAKVVVSKPDGTEVLRVDSAIDRSVSAGVQQVAQLEGLEPATTYCYALNGLTRAAGFRTAPLPGTGAAVRFAAFGDSGSGSSDQNVLLEQLRTVPFDFMVHTGDLAYENGSTAQLDRTVFRVYEPLLKSFAFYPITGNHDYETGGGGPFFEAFVLPQNGDSSLPERYYSFDWGDVHFVALDTERTGPAQAAWLDADLMQNRLPWTIVYGHRPPYSSGDHGSDAGFRKHFVPVLEKYQVPLVLSGHDHDYERSKELNGVTYVVTGGGGIGTRPVGSSSFTAFSEAVIHFLFIEIQENTLELHAIDARGREFDQVVIERSAGY